MSVRNETPPDMTMACRPLPIHPLDLVVAQDMAMLDQALAEGRRDWIAMAHASLRKNMSIGLKQNFWAQRRDQLRQCTQLLNQADRVLARRDADYPDLAAISGNYRHRPEASGGAAA